MRAKLILLHAAVLAAVNFGSIIGGFAVYYLAPWDRQLAIQIPVAILLNTVVFVGWFALTHRGRWRRLALREPADLVSVFAVALLWAPLVFVPLHLVMSGYLTSVGNLQALAFYQVVANLLVLPICGKLWPALSFDRD